MPDPNQEKKPERRTIKLTTEELANAGINIGEAATSKLKRRDYLRRSIKELGLPSEPQKAILSDIHGNFSALKTALEDIRMSFRTEVREALIRREEQTSRKPRQVLRIEPGFEKDLERDVDLVAEEIGYPQIYCLGDIVGYNLQTIEVLEEAMKFAGCCMGNHERAAFGAYNGLSAGGLKDWLGISMESWAAETLEIVGDQLTELEDEEQQKKLVGFLEELVNNRTEVEIRQDARGIHGFNIDKKLKYPLTKEMARKYGIPMSDYDLLCIDPEKMLTDPELCKRVFPEGVSWRFTGHSHVPDIAILDPRGFVIHHEPDRGRESRSMYMTRVTLQPGQKAFINVGSSGISRRKDKETIRRAKDMGMHLDCSYYGLLWGNTFYFREFFYDPSETETITRKIRREFQEMKKGE